jgi:integrase/recombinase XerD
MNEQRFPSHSTESLETTIVESYPLAALPQPVILPFDSSILASQLAPSSIAMYTRDFAAYLAFAGSPEAALDAATLARWRTQLAQTTAMSPHTINRMLAATKRLMKEAAQQGYIAHEQAEAFSHVRGVKVAALKTRVKVNARTRIEPAGMRAITTAADTERLIGLRNVALLHTLASSGLRASEVATLRREQVARRLNGYVVRVMGKNETAYTDTNLSVEAYEAIQAWLAARPVESDYIFTRFDGRGKAGEGNRISTRPLSRKSIWQIVKQAAEAAGLDHVKTHDLRRFVGTQLAKVDIRKAQKTLRHKRIETTATHYVLDDIEIGITDTLY